jgi:alanine-synthesizing transaminase
MHEVKYAIRDLVEKAKEIEKQGHEVIKLNIGDPMKFDFETPQHMIDAVIKAMKEHKAEGYEDSMGIPSAREAIAKEAARKKIPDITEDDVIIGNGASEVIILALGALLNDGDNVLTPSPGYPLYTGFIPYFSGKINPYLLDETNGWQPDIEDIEKNVNERTRAIVLINPNNPTGAVYSEEALKGIVEIAKKHNLVIFSDEIYDRLLFDGREHTATASLAEDVPVLTFGGLSKNYLVPGWRVGWVIISDPAKKTAEFVEGIKKAARSRLCSVAPLQHAIEPALLGPQDHLEKLVGPDGKLTKRREIFYNAINSIPGLSCTKPEGAFYAFPKFEKKVKDDEKLVIDLLKQEKLLVVHGTGFGWHNPDHFRITILPDEKTMEEAMTRLKNFFSQ